MKLFVLTLLIAGSIATPEDSVKIDSPDTGDCIGENGDLKCQNQLRITVADTWAGECFTSPGCRDFFCNKGEIIDPSTCTPDGRLQDCKCISASTIAPATVLPTQGPFVGCESCLNSKVSVGDTFAGHCFPNRSNGECFCLCADVFCRDGQIINKTACVSGGSLSDCKCIDVIVSTTASTPTAMDF